MQLAPHQLDQLLCNRQPQACAFGTLLGIATALNLAVSPAARYLIRPALVATQSLPVFALAPILTLWLGFGIGSKIAMAVLIIYFPVTSAFFDGLMRTPPGFLDRPWLSCGEIC